MRGTASQKNSVWERILLAFAELILFGGAALLLLEAAPQIVHDLAAVSGQLGAAGTNGIATMQERVIAVFALLIAGVGAFKAAHTLIFGVPRANHKNSPSVFCW